MAFLVEKSAIERLEIKCFYLQYCKSSFSHPWWDKLLPFSTKGLEEEVFVQIIEFSPSHLEDDPIKVYSSPLPWGGLGRGTEIVLCLNVYKYLLLFFTLSFI